MASDTEFWPTLVKFLILNKKTVHEPLFKPVEAALDDFSNPASDLPFLGGQLLYLIASSVPDFSVLHFIGIASRAVLIQPNSVWVESLTNGLGSSADNTEQTWWFLYEVFFSTDCDCVKSFTPVIRISCNNYLGQSWQRLDCTHLAETGSLAQNASSFIVSRLKPLGQNLEKKCLL